MATLMLTVALVGGGCSNNSDSVDLATDHERFRVTFSGDQVSIGRPAHDGDGFRQAAGGSKARAGAMLILTVNTAERVSVLAMPPAGTSLEDNGPATLSIPVAKPCGDYQCLVADLKRPGEGDVELNVSIDGVRKAIPAEVGSPGVNPSASGPSPE